MRRMLTMKSTGNEYRCDFGKNKIHVIANKVKQSRTYKFTDCHVTNAPRNDKYLILLLE